MKKYYDCLDRIYLNECNIKKLEKQGIYQGKAYKDITEQIRKDKQLKQELEVNI